MATTGRIGPYEVERELGRGGMGRVLLVRHTKTGVARALKVLEGTTDAEAVARFRREAATLERLGTEGVVAVHDSGTESGRLWFAMTLMGGGSLRDRLRARRVLPWREAASIGARIARTLQRVHLAGLVHRDLKPDNVLFDDGGEPRLADFGCVRELDARSQLTATGTTLGTSAYMAPEQIDARPVDGRADVWALGCVLYELVTGEPPHAGRSAHEVAVAAIKGRRAPIRSRVSVPPGYEAIVERALAIDPAARPDAGAVAAALETLEEDSPAGSPRRARAVAVAAAFVALAGVAAALVALAPWRAGAPPPPPPPAKVRAAADLLADVEKAPVRDAPLAAAIDVAIAAEPRSRELRAVRARARQRWGLSIRADDLVLLVGGEAAAPLVRHALSAGLEGDGDDIAAVISAGRRDGGDLAVPAAIEELRTGSVADRKWLEAALDPPPADGPAKSVAALVSVVRRIASELSDDLVLPALAEGKELNEAGRKLALAAGGARRRLGEDGLDAALDPIYAAMRRVVVPPEDRNLRTSMTQVALKLGFVELEGGPRLDALLLALLGGGAKTPARLIARARLDGVDRSDPLVSIRARQAVTTHHGEAEDKIDRRAMIRPVLAIGDRALDAAATPRERIGLLIVFGHALAIAAGREVHPTERVMRPEHLERAKVLFDRHLQILGLLEREPGERIAAQVRDVASSGALVLGPIWSEERERALLATAGGVHHAETHMVLAHAAIGRGALRAIVEAHVARAARATRRDPKPTAYDDAVRAYLERR